MNYLTIDAAIEHGINHFDTAYTYQGCDSERFLGEALLKYPRDSYYFATKFYAVIDTDIRAVFKEQLIRSQTEYFDFFLLHGTGHGHWHDDASVFEFHIEFAAALIQNTSRALMKRGGCSYFTVTCPV